MPVPESKHGFNIEWNNNPRKSISKLNTKKIFEGTSFNAKDSCLYNKLLMMRRIQSMKRYADQYLNTHILLRDNLRYYGDGNQLSINWTKIY